MTGPEFKLMDGSILLISVFHQCCFGISLHHTYRHKEKYVAHKFFLSFFSPLSVLFRQVRSLIRQVGSLIRQYVHSQVSWNPVESRRSKRTASLVLFSLQI